MSLGGPSVLARALELADRLCALPGPSEFRATARTCLQELLPGHEVLWTAADRAAGTALVESLDGPDPELTRGLALSAGDHPSRASYLARPTDLTPRRVSDVAGAAAWRETAAYREVFGPIGGLHQLSLVVTLTPPGSGEGFVVLRDVSDFRDDECDLAARLLPTLTLLDRLYARGTFPWDAPAALSAEEARERWRLTPREHDILVLLADGLTAESIGRIAGISARTVRKHLEHVYDKLGIHDRLLAVDRARSCGLVRS
jgi:DNA-binding CsgD family transcriptional regulator